MKRPIIVTEPPPEFGELLESPSLKDPSFTGMDLSYVPGLSDLRLRRDQAMLEVLRGERSAKDVPTIDYNGRWVRCQNKKGEPDSRKRIGAGNRGYRIVTKDMIGEGKPITSMPAGAVFNAAGEVQQGDTVLMIADADRVAKNEFAKRMKTASQTRTAEQGFEMALKTMGVKPVSGAAPFIQKEIGKTVRAELNPKK